MTYKLSTGALRRKFVLLLRKNNGAIAIFLVLEPRQSNRAMAQTYCPPGEHPLYSFTVNQRTENNHELPDVNK
jgi:hypothetical protein